MKQLQGWRAKLATAMMCWENMKNSLGKEPHKESDNEGKKPMEKTQKPQDEEEHVDSILCMGN